MGCLVFINISFNVCGELIVFGVVEVFCCFLLIDMDVLVVGDFLFEKVK